MWTAGGSTRTGTSPKASGDHSHAATNTGSTVGTGQSSTITVNNTTNDLAYKAVIFLKSDGSPVGVPVSGYGFFASDSLPTGWTRVNGNTYLKGAAGGADGGGTGGANTHSHTSPSHTHTANFHWHTALSAADSVGTGRSGFNFVNASYTHYHDVSLDVTTVTYGSVTTTISTDNHEPVFKKLNIINNGNASADLPNSLILLWGGTHAGIPANWSRFTSMDGNFLKGANADGESDVTTGGATTHTHTASSCQPTVSSHSHTNTDPGPSATVNNILGSPLATVAEDYHTHTWTVDNTVPTTVATSVTVNVSGSEAAYPQYKRLIFIQYTAPSGSVSHLAALGVG